MLQLGDPHFLGERPLGGDRVLLVSTGWRELCAPPCGGGVWARAPRGSVSASAVKSGAQIQRK